MRVLAYLLALIVPVVGSAQTAEPQVRPALIGNGPRAMVNLVDTNKLVEKGQGDALVFFSCYVATDGRPINAVTYAGTPRSRALDQAAIHALERCRFTPALYNGKPVGVVFFGTVMFFAKDGVPHLRVYANQNHDDLVQGNDFIAPQLIGGTDNWAKAKEELPRGYWTRGVIELRITVDANGNQKNTHVILEDPPRLNFGHAMVTLYSTAKFIPGFRNEQPVESTFDCTRFLYPYKTR